ncbi:hypothetical protein D5H75_19155 [Bailinhaonella thermotolerans]|uniref:Uncharacterized protein n=1 Tax=Bailinhaonella thermotolerans TaxID=1070861 RepID=A0A3A4B339_9ACTN|nr:hypothetical protein D5H75_19155 [Bailinhaonella thermotolerans]
MPTEDRNARVYEDSATLWLAPALVVDVMAGGYQWIDGDFHREPFVNVELVAKLLAAAMPKTREDYCLRELARRNPGWRYSRDENGFRAVRRGEPSPVLRKAGGLTEVYRPTLHEFITALNEQFLIAHLLREG